VLVVLWFCDDDGVQIQEHLIEIIWPHGGKWMARRCVRGLFKFLRLLYDTDRNY
jgi:hypothetical protein